MASAHTEWSVTEPRVSGALALLALTALVLGCADAPERLVAPPGLPQAQVQAQLVISITGTTRALTTTATNQFDPAISGNIVVYNEAVASGTDVAYVDLSSGTATNITSSTDADEQMTDVSGNTIVYTRTGHTTADSDVMAFVIGAGSSAVAAVAGSNQLNPAISGNVVAWEDTRDGNREIYAKDLATGTVKRLTNTPSEGERDPAVSGTRVVYVRVGSTDCQIWMTDFATEATTQITSVAGCDRLPDISGNTVVYQGLRGGDQDIFVYDLTTATETRLSLPGTQRNPNVSGDWVAYEDVGSTGASDIKLYHVPTATHFTAVATANNEFLNDIDGTRVAYTSDAAGNFDIYLFEFQVQVAGFPLSLAITSLQLKPSGAEKVQLDLDVTLDAASDGIDPPGETVSLELFKADGTRFYPTAFVDLVNGFIVTSCGWSISDEAKSATGIQAFNINRTADPRTFTIHLVDTRTGLVQDPLYQSVSARLTIGNDGGSSSAIAPRQQSNGDWVFP